MIKYKRCGLLVIFFMILIFTFQVQAAGFEFSDLQVDEIGDHSFRVIWETTVPTSGQIHFSDNIRNLNQFSVDPLFSVHHTNVIIGLKSGTVYYFRITARPEKGKPQKTDIQTLTTSGMPAPRILGVKPEMVTRDMVDFRVYLNIPTAGVMVYGEDQTQLTNIVEFDKFTNDFDIRIQDLKPLTVYYYQLRIIDKEKNVYFSGIRDVKTGEWNVALDKKVTGTFRYFPETRYIKTNGGSLRRVTDGKMSYFTGMATSGPVPDAMQHITIDLEKAYKIHKVIIYWRSLSYSKDYKVLLTASGGGWKTIAEHVDASQGYPGRSEGGDPIHVMETECNGESARYIRIIIPKGSEMYNKHDDWSFVQIMEVKVYPVYE